MFYAAFTDGNGIEQSNLYYNYPLFFADTFSPDSKIYAIIEFKVKGKTYKEKQENARKLAINFQHEKMPGLSWGEIVEIQGYFEKIGKRYGLLKEFREEGVC